MKMDSVWFLKGMLAAAVRPDGREGLAEAIREFEDALARVAEAERKLAEAHPTTEECEAMGRNGGLPDTPEERTRFEAYMRGHSWEPGPYDGKKGCYWETVPRMLYGAWRDRGALCGSRAQLEAAPGAVSVPVERVWVQAGGRDDKQFTDGWNACRATMLAAAKGGKHD